jgi:hypothetical protein
VTQLSLPAAQSGEHKLVTNTNSKEVKADKGGGNINLMKNPIRK